MRERRRKRAIQRKCKQVIRNKRDVILRRKEKNVNDHVPRDNKNYYLASAATTYTYHNAHVHYLVKCKCNLSAYSAGQLEQHHHHHHHHLLLCTVDLVWVPQSGQNSLTPAVLTFTRIFSFPDQTALKTANTLIKYAVSQREGFAYTWVAKFNNSLTRTRIDVSGRENSP